MTAFQPVRYTIRRECGEWVVRFFGSNDEYNEHQTYYTDDYDDAVATANAEMRVSR